MQWNEIEGLQLDRALPKSNEFPRFRFATSRLRYLEIYAALT